MSASIESGRQNVRETVARARFHIEIVKKLTVSDHFLKMRSTKNVHETVARARFHMKIVYKTDGLIAISAVEVDKNYKRLSQLAVASSYSRQVGKN